MQIEKLPIYVLQSFGHSGIEWAHSLLDSHSEILIMPAFSFFRTLYKIEKINGLNLKTIKDNENLAKVFSDIFYYDKSYQVKRRRFIFNQNQKELFEYELKNYLDTSNENFIKKLFFGIHLAFCKIHDIDIAKIKCIIIHEHVSWHFIKYDKLFYAKHILVFRNPKAVIAGSILKMRRLNKEQKINAYQLDHIVLDMLSTFEILKKHQKNKVFILKNETMHLDLINEMKKLCLWMNIGFEKSLLEQTFLGAEWFGESSYLAQDELEKYPPKNFYLPEEVERRWRSVLTKKDILFVDMVFRDLIKKLNYIFDFKPDLLNIILGYKNYLLNYNYQDKYFLNKYLIILRNIIRRILLILFSHRVERFFNFK